MPDDKQQDEITATISEYYSEWPRLTERKICKIIAVDTFVLLQCFCP